MNQKSLKFNALLNGIRRVCYIIFPLITFPYVSRVMGAEAIGKFNFSNTIISFLVLISSLGINNYAMRDGAKVRDDKEKFQKFISEVFSISLVSTLISYILLFILLFIPKINSYMVILLILSIQILFNTIGVEWIYNIFEDHVYLTIRSIGIQILSLILLLLFVHSPDDLLIYAVISAIAGTGSNVLNLLFLKKYCKLKVTKELNLEKHLKPILILFASQIAITVYASSDIAILGFICDDYTVGIYAISVKIYTILKSVLAAIVVVSIPRFSYYIGTKNNDAYKKSASNVYKTILTLCIPTIFGLILLSKEAVLLVGGNEYLQSYKSLILLSLAIMFCIASYFWDQCVLIPHQEEKKVLFITMVTALVNVVLNLIFIPFYSEVAAAATTVISEALVFIYSVVKGKKYLHVDGVFKTLFKISVGCILMTILVLSLKHIVTNFYLYIILSLVLSVMLYFIVELLLNNECLDFIKVRVKKILKRM